MNSVISPVKTEERVKLGIRPGDTVRVHQKILERGKTRVQTFEGLVIAMKHGSEAGATFTVRAMLSGIGVEKIFPLYAPFIEKIEIVRRSKVRRAKLYFIRDKVSREVRRQLRNMRMVSASTDESAIDESDETSTLEEMPVPVADLESDMPEVSDTLAEAEASEVEVSEVAE